MAHFAGQREIGVNFPMRAVSVDPKNTHHATLTIPTQEPSQAVKKIEAGILEVSRSIEEELLQALYDVDQDGNDGVVAEVAPSPKTSPH